MKAANKLRLLLDTNIIISGILFKSEVLCTLLGRAFGDHKVVFSYPAWDGLCEAMSQEQFEPNLALGVRLRALAELARRVRLIDVRRVVTDCCDPKDNKFLALALECGVAMAMPENAELLTLHSWCADFADARAFRRSGLRTNKGAPRAF